MRFEKRLSKTDEADEVHVSDHLDRPSPPAPLGNPRPHARRNGILGGILVALLGVALVAVVAGRSKKSRLQSG